MSPAADIRVEEISRVSNLSLPVPHLGARYEIRERLGAGGMAEVFRARVVGSRDQVALKRLRPELAADSELSQILVREAELGLLVQHPVLVRVYDLEYLDGESWLVMELVDGIDLARLLRVSAGRLHFPLAAAVRIALEVLDGLDHLHRTCDAEGRPLGVVHRDVSPANILVTEAGEVRLIDFGIAARRDRPGLTRMGEIKGKPRWMAPEQVLGGPVDARTDVFAVGMILLALVSGRDPYDGATADEILARIKKGGIATLPPLDDAIPRGLEKILSRAIAANPLARFRDAKVFRGSLREWAVESDMELGPRPLAELVAAARDVTEVPPALPPPRDDEPDTLSGRRFENTGDFPVEVARRMPTIATNPEYSDLVDVPEGASQEEAAPPEEQEEIAVDGEEESVEPPSSLGFAAPKKPAFPWANVALIAGGVLAFAAGLALAG